jgi:hypothetical protein
MTADNHAKMDARVSLYLERCKLSLPSGVASFLNAMKDEHGWTDAELIQLQGHVIGVLAERIVPARRRKLLKE